MKAVFSPKPFLPKILFHKADVAVRAVCRELAPRALHADALVDVAPAPRAYAVARREEREPLAPAVFPLRLRRLGGVPPVNSHVRLRSSRAGGAAQKRDLLPHMRTGQKPAPPETESSRSPRRKFFVPRRRRLLTPVTKCAKISARHEYIVRYYFSIVKPFMRIFLQISIISKELRRNSS